MPTFEVKAPVGANQIWMRQQIREAVAEATRRGKLRPNSVDSITGKNSGDNLGPGTPIIHFDQWERDDIEVKLILKGGGCENTNAQYALPVELPHLGRADRTLDGVKKCILHAVWKAQGKGCSPGRGRRLRRRRPHVRLHAREGAAVPHARRRESRSAAGGGRSVDHGDGERPRHRPDGVRRQGHAHRLQDRRAQPPAGELLRLGRIRLLGVPPSRRRAGRAHRRDRALAVSRSVASDHADARSGRLPAHGTRGRAPGAAQRRGRAARSRSATSCWSPDAMFTGRDAVHAPPDFTNSPPPLPTVPPISLPPNSTTSWPPLSTMLPLAVPETTNPPTWAPMPVLLTIVETARPPAETDRKPPLLMTVRDVRPPERTNSSPKVLKVAALPESVARSTPPE